ncbi:MAG: hypothetical protein ABI112_05510 [Terracoccus sp.]
MPSSQGDHIDYDRLNGANVKKTISSLSGRVQKFLPVSKGLPAVAAELHRFVTELEERSEKTSARRRRIALACRLLVVLVAGLVILATWSALRDALSAEARLKGFEWLAVFESGINDLVFAGIAIWFLTSFAARLERAELLKRLHRLRSLAHIIDMHQMSKNVSDLLPDREPTVPSQPGLTPRDYALYLDYCSELLSLTAKGAAMCAEESTDALVLDTVSEIESMTTGMSRKIWQKISLLHDKAPGSLRS